MGLECMQFAAKVQLAWKGSLQHDPGQAQWVMGHGMSWSSSPLWCLSTFTWDAMTGRNPNIRPGWADSNSRG